MGTLIIVLFHVVAIVDAQRKKFSCTAGNFSVGETASITCDFNKDVSKEHYSYYVGWYAHDSKDKVKGAEALACFRTLSEELVCNVAQGFRFNDIITDRLVLEIPNVTQRFAGQYSCQYVPPDGRRIKTCSLNVTVVKIAKSQSSGDTLPTPTPTRILTPTDPDTSSKEETFIYVIVSLVVFAVVGITASVIGMTLYNQRKYKRRKEPRPERGGTNSEISEEGRESFCFETWSKDLPKPVRKALIKEGFNNRKALQHAEESDFQKLKIKAGHAVELREAVQQLKKLRDDGGARGPVENSPRQVSDREITTSTGDVSIRAGGFETEDGNARDIGNSTL